MIKKASRFIKDAQKREKKITIADYETGHSYEEIFDPYIDDGVTEVQIIRPVLKQLYQVCLLQITNLH